MDRRNALFSVIISLLISVLFTGCSGNLTTKSSHSFHGTFVFFKNNKEIKGPVSWLLYNKINQKIETIIFDFGFIRDDEIKGLWFKNKNDSGVFVDYSGSDATISIVLINRSDFFRLVLEDHTYKEKTTEFSNKLIESIISTLKKDFDFSQITFEETGKSPFI